MTARLATVALAALLSGCPPAFAEPPEANTESGVALAALLISDGHTDRARVVLAQLDPTDPGVDGVRYWTLQGLVALDAGDPAAATVALESARAASGDAVDPLLLLTLARAQVRAGQPDAALATLDAAGGELDAIPSAWSLRARAHRDRHDTAGAWAALEGGVRRFPDHTALRRQQILLLLDAGLTRAAGEQARALLARPDTSEADVLVVAEALRLAGVHDQATALLEAALLRAPRSLQVRVRLAVVHLGAGRPLAAAQLFDTAAALDPTYAANAAALYLEAGRQERALNLNAQVQDPYEKVTQRFTILARTESWDRAAALDPRLERLGALSDEDVRYGLAYAHFETGDLDRAEHLLRGIEDARLFRQATALRQAIQQCRDTPEQCG